jgi:hypothetical protein
MKPRIFIHFQGGMTLLGILPILNTYEGVFCSMRHAPVYYSYAHGLEGTIKGLSELTMEFLSVKMLRDYFQLWLLFSILSALKLRLWHFP